MVSSRSRLVLISLAVGATALLVFHGTGLHPAWWLTWPAPLPLLLIAPRVSARLAFLAAAIAWFAGSLNMWHYLRSVVQVPTGAAVAAVVAPSCIFALLVLVYRSYARNGVPWAAALSLPVLWVSCEYLSSVASPHGTFGSLAYTQMDFLPLLQIASLTGLWGITFLLFLLPASFALLAVHGPGRSKRVSALAASVVLCLVVLWGYARLRAGAPDAHVPVRLIASDLPANRFPQSDSATLRLLRDYAAEVTRIPSQNGASGVVVLPEKLGVLSQGSLRDADRIFEKAAEQSRAMTVVGLDSGTAKRRSNEARLYSDQGHLQSVYVKHHLIPGLEDVDVPGSSRVVLREGSGVWGVAICKDMDFPALGRQYGRDGVGLLLAPAWDFDVDGWLHSRMAILRGVESGFTVARSAKQGLLTVSDNRGRVLSETSSSHAPFSVLVADAPVSGGRTIYARWGDWFAWLNLGGGIVLLFGLVPLRARSRRILPSDLQ